MTVAVPDLFARATVEREGASGAEWLRSLPAMIDDLLDLWDCVVDGPVSHGWVGLIVPVRRANDQAAVMKVSFRHPGNIHEPIALSAWQGNGAVQLYERADTMYAMLLERAHPAPLGAVRDVDVVMEIAGGLNARLSLPAPAELLPLQQRVDGWTEELCRDVAEFNGALGGPVTDMALETIRDLGAHQPSMLIHGDFHPGNILRADREPWLAIDPKGYAGDPGYDAGVMIKWRAMALLEVGNVDAHSAQASVLRALRIYCTSADIDAQRALRWSQLLLVQAAFWGRRHGFETARRGQRLTQAIALADLLAASLATP